MIIANFSPYEERPRQSSRIIRRKDSSHPLRGPSRDLLPATAEEKRIARVALGWPSERRKTVFTGALGDRRKGFDVLFDAWRQLCADSAWDVDLAVVGSGVELRAWKAGAAADPTISTRVDFLGFRDDVPRILAAADLLVSPVRYEACGLGIHEALCCGVPAVSITSAGIAERYSADLRDLLLPEPPEAHGLHARLQAWRGRRASFAGPLLGFTAQLRSQNWEDSTAGIFETAKRFPGMTPMRIILVLPDPPLPFGTAAARWYYVLLKGLQDRGHLVTVYAACATAAHAAEAGTLFPSPAYDLRCFLYPKRTGWRAKWETVRKPYSYVFGPDLKADLARRLAEGFDVLHLEIQWSGWLGLDHSACAVVNIHSLYSVDLAKAPIGSWWDRLRSRRVFAAEKKLLRSYPRIITLSNELAMHLRRFHPKADIQIIPLGFDSKLYPFDPNPPARLAPPTIGLIGSFDWYPTYTAGVRLLTRLWPEIRRRVPTCRLLLVGRQACSALADHLSREIEGLTVEEDVSDTLPYFQRLDIMVYAPTIGTGMKVKVLEAFALGVPVVTNAVGVEGLPAFDTIHAGIAERDDDLVERCVTVLQNREMQNTWRIAARALIVDYCAPESAITSFEQAYQHILWHRGSNECDKYAHEFLTRT